MRIGDHHINGKVLLAPMAGVSDRPCRSISHRYGAALATGEMVISDPKLWHTSKSQQRLDFSNNPGLISVQIAGSNPQQMALAAQALYERGIQILDINLGCPAKKVCGAASGSALLRDLPRVRAILEAVVGAVPIPVTLKTRTGWDAETQTAAEVVQMADAIGIQAIALHGRTRAQHFNGEAEHDTLARLRELTDLPLIANGDIHCPLQAAQILQKTGADAVMIGRAAQGNPWLIEQTHQHLSDQAMRSDIPDAERHQVIRSHVEQLHLFYGEFMGVRFARKHLRWYLEAARWDTATLQSFNALETPETQLAWLDAFSEAMAA